MRRHTAHAIVWRFYSEVLRQGFSDEAYIHIYIYLYMYVTVLYEFPQTGGFKLTLIPFYRSADSGLRFRVQASSSHNTEALLFTKYS